MEYLLEEYDNTLQRILNEGKVKTNKRTGIKTLSVFGVQTRYPLNTERFPILTRRKVFPKAIFAELLWFLSGSTNNKDLQALGSNIWTPWVDKEFEKKWGFVDGALGPVYGFNLRNFGGEYGNGENNGQGGFDQLTYIIERLKNDPTDRRILFSLWNPKELDRMRLPPCFTKCTIVNTEFGMKNIEDVNLQDKVFVDNKWEKVTDKHVTFYKGQGLKFYIYSLFGHPIKCTTNHPFFIKDKGWTRADEIEEGDYCFLPKNKNSIDPIFEGQYINQYTKRKNFLLTNNDWWVIGYYLGDGWKNKERIRFAISEKEKDYILPKIRKSIKVCKKPEKVKKSCYTYETYSKKWEIILKELGNKAIEKKIPKWVLDAPNECLQYLIEGYLDSDGCVVDEFYNTFNTISKQLAFGIQQIFWKLRIKANVNFHKRPDTCIIQGRSVNQKSYYSITTRHIDTIMKKDKFFIEQEDGYWLKIRKIEKIDLNEFVYNISVENIPQYCSPIKTHNCHYTYQVSVDDDRNLSGMLTQRSCDFPIGIPANIQFYSALTIMLAQQVDCKPCEFIHNSADAHLYENQIESVKEYLNLPIIRSPKLIINKAKDIYSYKMEDFIIEDFESGPKLKIPVAV